MSFVWVEVGADCVGARGLRDLRACVLDDYLTMWIPLLTTDGT